MNIHAKIYNAYKNNKNFHMVITAYKMLGVFIPHPFSVIYIKEHFDNLENTFFKLLTKDTLQKYYPGILSKYFKLLRHSNDNKVLVIFRNMLYIFQQNLHFSELDKDRIYYFSSLITEKFCATPQNAQLKDKSIQNLTDELLTSIRCLFNDDRKLLLSAYIKNTSSEDVIGLKQYIKKTLPKSMSLLYKLLMEERIGYDHEIFETLIELYHNKSRYDEMIAEDVVHLTKNNKINRQKTGYNNENSDLLVKCIKHIQYAYNLYRIPELASYNDEIIQLIDNNHMEMYLSNNKNMIVGNKNIDKLNIFKKIVKTNNFNKSIMFKLFDVKKVVKKHYNNLIGMLRDEEDNQPQNKPKISNYTSIEDKNIINKCDLTTLEKYVIANKNNTNDINYLSSLLLLNDLKRLSIDVNYDYVSIRRVFSIHKSERITGVLLEGHVNYDYLLLLKDVVVCKILKRKVINRLFYKILYTEMDEKQQQLRYKIIEIIIKQYRQMDLFIKKNDLNNIQVRDKKISSIKNTSASCSTKDNGLIKMCKRVDVFDIHEDNTEILTTRLWDEIQNIEKENVHYALKILIVCMKNTRKGFLLSRIEQKVCHIITLHQSFFFGKDMNLFFRFLECLLHYGLKRFNLLEQIFMVLLEYEQSMILEKFYRYYPGFFTYLCAGIFKIEKYLHSNNNVIWHEKHKNILKQIIITK